jgi:hypothetical protein
MCDVVIDPHILCMQKLNKDIFVIKMMSSVIERRGRKTFEEKIRIFPSCVVSIEFGRLRIVCVCVYFRIRFSTPLLSSSIASALRI